MDLRDQLIQAISDEKNLYEQYDAAREFRSSTAACFFEKKFGISKGDVVKLNGEHGREIMVDGFVMCSDSPDDVPDIEGRIKLPFGWSKKSRRYTPDKWMSKEDEDDFGNR